MSSPVRVPSCRQAAYPNLDLAKFLCALLVVIIHTSPLLRGPAICHFYLNDVIARSAVPVFYAISGFLFFRNIRFENGRIAKSAENRKRLLRTVRRNLTLYTLWSGAYLLFQLPDWYRSGWWGIHALADWMFAFLLRGSFYHLWFLLALSLAVPALYLLLSVIPLSRAWMCAAALWVLECLVYSYSWIGVDSIPAVAFITSRMPIVFDFLLRALPLLFIGASLSQEKHKPLGIGSCVIAFVLCAAEASALYFFSPNEEFYSYLFTTPLLAYAALNALTGKNQVSISAKWSGLLRDVSLLIYCIHPMLRGCFEQMGMSQGILLWLTVTALSVSIGCMWYSLKQLLSKHK